MSLVGREAICFLSFKKKKEQSVACPGRAECVSKGDRSPSAPWEAVTMFKVRLRARPGSLAAHRPPRGAACLFQS